MLALRKTPSEAGSARGSGGEFKVPALAELHPQLADLNHQHGEMRVRIDALKSELDASLAGTPATNKQQRAEDLLAGRDVAAKRPPGVISDELSVVRDATTLLEERIIKAKMQASAKAREIVAPEHARRVHAMATALLALRETFVDYLRLVEDLNSRDIAWSALYPMHPNFLGSPISSQDHIAIWLNQAVELGFIDKSAIPPELRR